MTERLVDLGGQKWAVHALARQLQAEGRDVLEMTIGEPDVPTPPELVEIACSSMRAGRTDYSSGRGEPALLAALSKRYSERTGQSISPARILCFPGTQTALYAVFMGLVEAGDEVLVGDPMYATYEGVIAASGASLVRVPLMAEHGFRLQASELEARISNATRAILINSPHNPTGAVLDAQDMANIGALARRHDLWMVVDEVYEELVFDDVSFFSPLSDPDLAARVIVVSSISKSHAAPGFRSGWAIGPEPAMQRLLPLSETMLFGNQPFIADMTAQAVSSPSQVAAGMRDRFARRARRVVETLHNVPGLRFNQPGGGMFLLMDVSGLRVEGRGDPARPGAMTGKQYALDLLHTAGVAVMPGCSFGQSLTHWVRLALTIDDQQIDEACRRIAGHARGLAERDGQSPS